MARRNKPINLPAPYLRRVWLEPSRITDREAYPFCLPLLHDDFELSFDRAITIIVGENGSGKHDRRSKTDRHTREGTRVERALICPTG